MTVRVRTKPLHVLAARILREVRDHPGNRDAPNRAVLRSVLWQVRKRLAWGPVALDAYGLRITLPRDSGSLSNYFYFGEAFEWSVIRFLRSFARPGDVIVDGGANVGMFTYASWAVVRPDGVVHAFEPIDQYADVIGRNVLGNGLQGRVVVHAAALSDREGTVQFTSDLDVSNHMAWSKSPPNRTSIPVPTTRVDRLVQPPVALVKLDVEGAEFLALKGCKGLVASETPPHVFIVEAHDHSLRKLGSSRQEVIDLLDTWGYEPVVLADDRKGLRYPTWGGITQGDLICVHRSSRALVEARINEQR